MSESPVSSAGRHKPAVALDRQLALEAAASRLQEEFGDQVGMHTIEKFLQTSYDHFAAHARIPNFVPLLAERFARQQLQAVARMEGSTHDGKPTVLFLSTNDAGLSQMALGFFIEMSGERALVWSGGSKPARDIDPAVIDAMAEAGIDITHEYPKPWTDEILQAADVIVTMGCADSRPVFDGKRYEEWDLPDPAFQSTETVRAIRDDIQQRVRLLLAELNAQVRGRQPKRPEM